MTMTEMENRMDCVLDTIEKRMVQNPVFRTELEEMIKEIKGS